MTAAEIRSAASVYSQAQADAAFVSLVGSYYDPSWLTGLAWSKLISVPAAVSALSGTNTGDNAVNSLYSGLVSNATHTGDATGATALTLATVNANVGSFGSATQSTTVTVNAKGLVTAASQSTITPAVVSITGLGTGVSTALGVAVGSAGALITNGGALGTPASGVLTNCTGTASGLTAGNVTTNANLTGDVTSVGNATTIGSAKVTNAMLAGSIAISKLSITGTPDGTKFLRDDGSWQASSGGSPGGSSGQLQYNNASAFGGANLWFSTDLIEQRNSTMAQRFRIANTWTSATVFEQFQILAVASTGYRIGCAIGSAGGTGGASRQLDFGRWNAAGTWTSMLTWDSNDFLCSPSSPIKIGTFTGADFQLFVGNTEIRQTSDGAGFGLATNAYGITVPTATGSTGTFITRSGIGNSSRLCALFSAYLTTASSTSFFDWRQGAASSTSTTSLMRLTFDGQLTMYGTKINTAASTTTQASLNVPSGTAPTSPVNGDIWSDGSDIKVRLGGVTYTLTKV